jgi:hypothetical protein
VGEVDIDAGLLGEGFVVSHLGSLIEGHGAPHLAVEAVEDPGEGLGGEVGSGAVQLHQSDEYVFDQRADLRAVALTDDQVALPVAWDQSHLDLDGSVIDQNHVWNGRLAGSGLASLRPPGAMPAAHQAQQAGAQPALLVG